MRAPIGIRIRNRRTSLGLSQTALARDVGISPSYLNRIEGNKREVGGALLMRIAERLGLPIDRLSGENEQRLIQSVAESRLDPVLDGIDLKTSDARDLVAQFPEAAAAISRLHRAYSDATASVEAYANRLRTDPLFSQLLHEILSRITAMRSTAEILDGVPDLGEPDRARFLRTINKDARDLTDTARTLVNYFDQSVVRQRSVSPGREVDDLIFEEKNHFPALEEIADALRSQVETAGPFGEASLGEALERHFGVNCRKGAMPDLQGGFSGRFQFDADSRVLWFRNSTTAATRQFQMARLYAELAAPDALEAQANDRRLTSPAARQLAYRAMASYLAGAMTMPYSQILDEAERQYYDIELLSQSYSASFEQVAHRFVTLRRPGAEGVPFGFLRSDPAGRLTKHFPLPGLILPNTGHGCPLWAIYEALRRERIVRQTVEFTNGARYLFVAKAVSKRVAAYQEQPVYSSVMLACDILHADRTIYGRGLNLADATNLVPVGASCRLCARHDCAHRQEEALDEAGENLTLHTPFVTRDFSREKA
ncbi:XRE family transcriptional regulator [Pseudaminobacter arsenicus]|uniref:XRE family transcriptional regulator n=1 Tax=Borborobacter arsenicus TaxID=1851146 RepID=A0A432VCM5_9HYPH|nr:helix-turn-helix transcriptional regulator [Pseudaminobacter arsenicus]RUM99866.1 XRE family transcriptional regulator [Pseudaminobacter arsenicus]